VGTRGDADMMILTQAQNLERIHEFHVVLTQSGLMGWSSVPYSFLAMTKPSEYSEESRLEVRPAHGKYLFVYPFVKTRAWYALRSSRRGPGMRCPGPSATGSCRSTSGSAASIPR
jgi:chlorite dismutase